MKYSSATMERVLAIDPSTRGLGFAVLEGPERLIDWGTRGVGTDKNRESLTQVTRLIERYRPDVIVIEDYRQKSARRRERVRELLSAIVKFGERREIRVRRVSRLAIKKALSANASPTKYQIASEIAKRFPELAPRLPPLRRPWMSEDDRMSIFNSVSLALTIFLS